MTCPRCGTHNPPEAQFCMRCGAQLARRCPTCGADNPLDAHFCLRCGTPLGAGRAAERRVVTVLFADLVGSTMLTIGRDPEEVRGLIGDYFATMRDEIARYGGTVEKFIGDAVMAVFGLPAAHEDDPERAVRAAAAMQRRLTELNARQAAGLQLRIGVATGEVVADTLAAAAGQFMVTGEAVNLAARLQEDAPADGVLVDPRTYGATRAMARYEPVRPSPGDEFTWIPRWRLVALEDGAVPRGRLADEHRLRAPLVGREDELHVLSAIYRRVAEERRHHVVTIFGAAGVGKTRLAAEFIGRLLSGDDGAAVPSPPAAVLQGRCPAYGEGLTYWPIVEMLKQDCSILDSDPPAVAGQKLRECVARATASVLGEEEESERIAADLASLLGIRVARHYEELWRGRLQALKQAVEGGAVGVREPGEGERRKTADDQILRSWRAFLVARAQAGPVVLVFEDLHWAEESLLDLLERLAGRGTDAPILTLCLARPELLERHPEWGVRARNYAAVSLSPLSDAHSRRLVAALVKGEGLPEDVRGALLARAEGNPFFIEEILRMLVDSGDLLRANGGWRWAEDRPFVIRIPDTIHGILASRLDLVSPLERRVIQMASVAGRSFWLRGLVATGEFGRAEAEVALERLQERDLIEERTRSSIAGDREFAFKHSLIREVAYATLPKSARSAAHLAFADWLQTAAGDGEESLEVLAHHIEQAWRYQFETGVKGLPDLARRAVETLRRAAARAESLRAMPEARRLYDRAIAVARSAGLDADAVLLSELLVERSEAARWASGPTTVFEDTEAVLRLAPSIGREDLVARASLSRAWAEYTRERLEPAEAALWQALEGFRRLGDRQGEAEALEILGAIIGDLRGSLSRAVKAYRDAIEIYRAIGHGRGVARASTWLGRTLINIGKLSEARALLEQALALARQHGERLSEPGALSGLATLAHLTGDPSGAVRWYREAIAMRQEMGDPLGEASHRRQLGMHHLRYGKLDEAERELQTARTLVRQQGRGDSPFTLRGLAEVALARGDLLAAADYAERAVAGLTETDDIAQATHRATLGKIRAAQGRAEEAEGLFRDAVRILEEDPDRREYVIDLALVFLRHGEALLLLGQLERARQPLERAHALFSAMGATRLAQDAAARLQAARDLPEKV